MHWVDMTWLWGYEVLPGSVADMVALCREAGVKGGLNFDGVGLEKLAADRPAALTELREAVDEGLIEPVGGSYGQPYGLFHGGESNVRQRIFGIRSTMRLLGARPRVFWEEEFDFFPQLPQILAGCGYQGASLFFQWTWHTPHIPIEEAPVVQWEGLDGTALPTATRNRLNLHQWPEDMEILLAELAAKPPAEEALVAQWLELMPSLDWMCRCEVILPKLKEFLADPRFTVRPVTLGEYLTEPRHAQAPRRRYRMDEVWHGLTLGKNGDQLRLQSRETEDALLRAEVTACLAGVFGRPYPRWDVYPAWEIDEAWRELLQAQHHDNDECEGLCGDIGQLSYQQALLRATAVTERSEAHLMAQVGVREGELLVVNSLGWDREVRIENDEGAIAHVKTPGMGYTKVKESTLRFRRPSALKARVSKDGGVEFRDASLRLRLEGVSGLQIATDYEEFDEEGNSVLVEAISLQDGIEISLQGYLMGETQPGYGGSLRLVIPVDPASEPIVDQPYGEEVVQARGRFVRKYPEGDWMTSPQWFEDVVDPFFASSYADFGDILVLLDRPSQWLRHPRGFSLVLWAYDPWDEDQARYTFERRIRIARGGGTGSSRRRQAREFQVGPWQPAVTGPRSLKMPVVAPNTFSLARVEPDGVLLTALYREPEGQSGLGLDRYSGRGMGMPFLARLVEADGQATRARLSVRGTVARAVRTNLMGESIEELGVSREKTGSIMALEMRAHEIATVMFDLEEGRKRNRDLDAHRGVWATVHRQPES